MMCFFGRGCFALGVLGTGLAALLTPAHAPAQGRPDVQWMVGGHVGGVVSLAYSPNGDVLATGSFDQTVKVWRSSDGALLRTLPGFREWVFQMAFSPDGTLLAVPGDRDLGSSPIETNIWRISDGALVKTFPDGARCVAFSPDGKLVAIPANDHTIRLHRTSDWTQIRSLGMDAHIDFINALAFAPDGKTLVSGSSDKTLKIWRTDDGTPIRTLTGHTKSIVSVAVSPDGGTIASTGSDATVKLWRTSDGALLHNLAGHTMWVNCVRFSPDGQWVASASWDDTVRVWRVSDGAPIATLTAHAVDAESVSFSPDGSTLASCDDDGKVLLWSVPGFAPTGQVGRLSQSVLALDHTPDGRSIVLGTYGDPLGLNAANGTRERTFLGHTSGVFGVACSPDGQWVATAAHSVYGTDRTVRLFRASDGALVRSWTHPAAGGKGVAFSPDGRALAAVWGDGEAVLWRVSDGETLLTIPAPPYTEGMGVAFSPDGSVLAILADNKVGLWLTSHGVPLHTLVGSGIASMAFSPDGKRLATGGVFYDDTVRLWDVATGECLRSFEGHTGEVRGLAFAPDGRTLCSSSWYDNFQRGESTLRFWDAQSGVCLAAFDQELGTCVQVLDYSPDGSQIAAGREDATLMAFRNPFAKTLLSGDGTFGDFLGTFGTLPFAFELRGPDGAVLASWLAPLDPSGRFSIWTSAVLGAGECSLRIKGPHWLSTTVRFQPSEAASLRFAPLNGDVDGDDEVTAFDYNALSDAFDTEPDDIRWNPNADLDGDGLVSVFDYGILSEGFGKAGG